MRTPPSVFEYSRQDGVLCARALRDDASRAALFAVVRELARACRADGGPRCFVDLTPITEPLDVVDRIFLGAKLAELWPRRVRLAALALPHQVNHLAQWIAANRGVDVRTFADRAEAWDWLLAPVAPDAREPA